MYRVWQDNKTPGLRQPRWASSCWIVLALAALSLACARGGDDTAKEPSPTQSNPYLVTVDVTPWIRALGTDDMDVAEPAVARLTALGPAVVPVLEIALEREPPQVRVGVIEVLDQLGLPEVVPALVRAAGDPEAEVRAEAVMALGHLGDERGRDAVEAALEDVNRRVVGAALHACGNLCRSRTAMDTLVRYRLEGRRNADHSLSMILDGGDEERIAVAREAIAVLALPAVEQEEDVTLRLRAASLLLNQAPERALPILRGYARDGSNSTLRALVIMELGVSGGRDEAVWLESVLESLDDSPASAALRGFVCQSLKNMAARGLPVDRQSLDGCPAPGGGRQ